MKRADEGRGNGIQLIVGHVLLLVVAGHAEVPKPQLQPLGTRTLARDAHDVLSGPRIALDDRDSPFSEHPCEPDSASGQLLHAPDETWIDVDPAPLQLTLALAHDPEFVPSRVGIVHGGASAREAQRRVDRNELRARLDGLVENCVIRKQDGGLSSRTIQEAPAATARFRACEVDSDHPGHRGGGTAEQVLEPRRRRARSPRGLGHGDSQVQPTVRSRPVPKRRFLQKQVRMKGEAGDGQIQDRSHGCDVRAVVTNELLQRCGVTPHVPVPEHNRSGPVHIGEIITNTDVQLLLDCLLATLEANPAAEVHEIDVGIRKRDLRELLGDELCVEPDPVEGHQHLRTRGIFRQRARILSLDESLRGAAECPAHDGDLVVIMTEAGGLDVQKENALRERGAEGELLLQLWRDGPLGSELHHPPRNRGRPTCDAADGGGISSARTPVHLAAGEARLAGGAPQSRSPALGCGRGCRHRGSHAGGKSRKMLILLV